MSIGPITVGEQYGYRKTRELGSPLTCIEVFSKAKPGKWKIKFIDGPTAGLTDFVGTGNLRVRWEEAKAFINDELLLIKVMEPDEDSRVSDTEFRAATSVVPLPQNGSRITQLIQICIVVVALLLPHLPKTFDAIFVEDGIRTDDGQTFQHRLRDQESVKRITVVTCQRLDHRRMIESDG